MSSPDLRVALVHYHLRRGGVTEVLRRAIEGLAAQGVSCALLVGERESERFAGAPVECVRGLEYSERATAEGAELAGALEDAAALALGAPPDLFHVHNHSLGKNPALPAAVSELARRGRRLLLQVHDFPEDGRPARYQSLSAAFGEELSSVLYPQGEHIHYATLNGRDRAFLQAAGLDPARCHLLPNPVAAEPAGKAPASEGLVLYPTRAIRRKNLGELLLWAALERGGRRFATTLIPENPAERPRHDAWVALASELGLPVDFGLGMDRSVDFSELMARAECIISTSVAEGFGLAFLEPWLHGRAVVGRDLPEITADFAAEGIALEGLYARLELPLDWVGREELRARIAAGLTQSLRAYGREADPDAGDRAFEAAAPAGRVDFGRLDEELQAKALRQLAAAPARASEVEPRSWALPDAAAILAVRERVLAGYSLPRATEVLRGVYDRVASSPSTGAPRLDAATLLDRFLDPTRFTLLRT